MSSANLLAQRCEVDVRTLQTALNVASSVTHKRTPKPILLNVLMSIDPEAGSYLTATDLEVGVKIRLIGARSERPFKVLLNPARLAPILQRAECDSVAFALDDEHLTVTGKGFKFEFTTEAPDLYPAVPDVPTGGYTEVAAADLRRMIRNTRYATDPMSQRYALGGCLFGPADGQDAGTAERVVMVATDGRRLALMECPCVQADGGGFASAGKQSVLPLKALNLIERDLDDDDPPVKLVLDQNSIVLTSDRMTVWSRLVEGRFPNYREVFPGQPVARVTVKSGVLLGRTALASVATSEETRGVEFTLADGCLALKAAAADVGTSDVALPLDYDGPPLTFTLDSRYVLDAMAAVGPDVNLELRATDDKAPVVLLDSEFKYLIMPLTGS